MKTKNFVGITNWVQERIDDIFSYLDGQSLTNATLMMKWLRKLCWVAPAIVIFFEVVLTLAPLNTLNFLLLELFFGLILMINLIVSFFVNQMLIYIQTRDTNINSEERVEVILHSIDVEYKQISTLICALLGLPFVFTIIPYIEFLRQNPSIKGWTVAMTDQINGSIFLLRILIMSIPMLLVIWFYSRLKKKESEYGDVIEEWIRSFKFHSNALHHMLSGKSKKELEQANIEPYMIIGRSIKTNELVEQTPVTRRQNSIAFGPIGAGKTATIFKPQIKQDIDHYLQYIRDYPKISKDKTWMQPKGIANKYLNGFAVIETSNDLCRQIYELSLAEGIPEEKIIWLDPSNPKTPAINLLRGPVDTVVENVTNIISGVKAGNSDFFKESERNHLKNFIYLLKLTSVMTNEIATFNDLMLMYNDIYEVVRRIDILEQYVEALSGKLSEIEDEYSKNPDDTKLKVEYAEVNDKYEVAFGTYQWFKNNIKVATFGQGVLKVKEGKHKGEYKYIDANDEFVRGLKNTLDDMSKNIYLRRVLFRDSGDFNIDDLLYNGGILLCNTAKGEIGDQLAEMLGQIYMLSLQAATFRRLPDCAPMFPIYADEFPDFVSEAFKSFAAQARKYNVPIIIAAQSPSQLSYKYGADYFKTLMTVMLTRCTFGDLGAEDAKILEPYFGEKIKVTQTINEQDIDITADQDSNRRMSSTRREKVPNITAAEIMGLEKFTVAVRTPGPQNSDMFNLIKTKFLNINDILNDPNRFNIDDPEDKAAYDEMIANERHGNPDFDQLDLEIIASLENGDIQYREPGSHDAEDNEVEGRKTKMGDADTANSAFEETADELLNSVSEEVKSNTSATTNEDEAINNAADPNGKHDGNNRLRKDVKSDKDIPQDLNPNKNKNVEFCGDPEDFLYQETSNDSVEKSDFPDEKQALNFVKKEINSISESDIPASEKVENIESNLTKWKTLLINAGTSSDETDKVIKKLTDQAISFIKSKEGYIKSKESAKTSFELSKEADAEQNNNFDRAQALEQFKKKLTEVTESDIPASEKIVLINNKMPKWIKELVNAGYSYEGAKQIGEMLKDRAFNFINSSDNSDLSTKHKSMYGHKIKNYSKANIAKEQSEDVTNIMNAMEDRDTSHTIHHQSDFGHRSPFTHDDDPFFDQDGMY